MSSRGATWRGRHERTMRQKVRSRDGQRNRRLSDKGREGTLADFPAERLEHMVRKCRAKVPHKSKGAAWQAKLAADAEHPGTESFIYECPICGKWHLTTHPWMKPGG